MNVQLEKLCRDKSHQCREITTRRQKKTPKFESK